MRIHPRPRFLPLILILLPLLHASISHAAKRRLPEPTPDKTLQAIHKKFKKLDSQREDFQKVELPKASQPAAEGSKATAYRGKSGKVLIVEESYFAEMGQAIWSYYYDGKKPFYIVVAETKYAYPITVNAADRKKLGGGEDKTSESRYYFKGSKLIRWLEGKKPVLARSDRFKDQAKSVHEFADSAYKNAVAFSAARR